MKVMLIDILFSVAWAFPYILNLMLLYFAAFIVHRLIFAR